MNECLTTPQHKNKIGYRVSRFTEKLNAYSKAVLKEGNVLFNDALSRFYLRLYGVGHMVKGHSNISSKGSFICTIL